MTFFELIQKINNTQAAIDVLPEGYISTKTIRGKRQQYLQWREGNTVKSRYIKAADYEILLEELEERKRLLLELEVLHGELDRLKAYGEILGKMYLVGKMNLGEQNFEELILGRGFYVDKTEFIRQWWESEAKVTLIPRPRRFGKTLNMSMLECFFSVRYRNRSDLFENLAIWTDPYYRKIQGTYPTILLSLADVKGENPFYLERIKAEICKVYREYEYLIRENLLPDNERQTFLKVHADMTDAVAFEAIPELCRLLYLVYGKKVILLLDEYDTPVLEAYLNGRWEQNGPFFRNWMQYLFKSNAYIHKGLITGITRIGKESFFSGLNHIYSDTYTSNLYAESFGFTQQEVFEAMDARGLGEKDKVRDWYNGFHFGDRTDIYNPWSVSLYLMERECKPFWVNTGSTELLGNMIKRTPQSFKVTFEKLLQGESIVARMHEEITFANLEECPEALWGLLVYSGYLKILSQTDEGMYELTVTNKEVSLMLQSMVKSWFGEREEYKGFLQALLEDDAEYMTRYLNMVSQHTFSYYDTKGEEPERFYHGFVLGMIENLRNQYRITSNRESGLGRYDVCLEPIHPEKNHGIILEFKVRRLSKEVDLEQTCQNALGQILVKDYARELEIRGLERDNIYAYGIAFQGKEVLVLGGKMDSLLKG